MSKHENKLLTLSVKIFIALLLYTQNCCALALKPSKLVCSSSSINFKLRTKLSVI